jgi:hypothetical protein
MKNINRLYLIPQFVLSVFNVFFILVLTLPFLAQSIHNILGGSLYFYLEEITLGISTIFACLVTFIVYQKQYRNKQIFIIMGVQFLVLVCCFLIFYFNMNELYEMLNKPTYE